MKYPMSINCMISMIEFGSAQSIHFDLADPQPVLQEVYGGSIVSGDLDNDGDVDLIQSGIGEGLDGTSAQVIVFLNDGNGNFTPQTQNFGGVSEVKIAQ